MWWPTLSNMQELINRLRRRMSTPDVVSNDTLLILDEIYSASPQFSFAMMVEGFMPPSKAWELWRELTSKIGSRYGEAFSELGFVGTVSNRLVLDRQGYTLTIVATVTGNTESFYGAQQSDVEHTLEHVLGDTFMLLTELGCPMAASMSSSGMPPGLAEALQGAMSGGSPLGVIRIPMGAMPNGQQPQYERPVQDDQDDQYPQRGEGPYL